MSTILTETRQNICDTLAEQLPGTTWMPRRPPGPKPGTGWLALTEVTSEGCTFGMLNVGFTAVLFLSTAEKTAQDLLDEQILDFHEAFIGWATQVRVQPDLIPIGDNTLFTITATFLTEVEAS